MALVIVFIVVAVLFGVAVSSLTWSSHNGNNH